MQLENIDLSEVDLTGADLFQANLRQANLKMAVLAGCDATGVNLAGADLYKVDLSGSFLTEAKLGGAYLAGANLSGADVRGANLTGANLSEADLAASDFSSADLSGATLARARSVGADFSYSNLSDMNAVELDYGSFRSMEGRFYGVRGLESCFGNALFVRDARDQDYLATLRRDIDRTPGPLARRVKSALFRAWSLIDYGRSLARPTLYAFCLAMSFGVLYSLDMWLGWGLMDYSGTAHSPLTPFYYSIVTYTTLGFGDITPIHWLGEVVIIGEVVLGYLTLGLLLSILANVVARRS
jgi:hypothetical protein